MCGCERINKCHNKELYGTGRLLLRWCDLFYLRDRVAPFVADLGALPFGDAFFLVDAGRGVPSSERATAAFFSARFFVTAAANSFFATSFTFDYYHTIKIHQYQSIVWEKPK
jgi:hypothetical protein